MATCAAILRVAIPDLHRHVRVEDFHLRPRHLPPTRGCSGRVEVLQDLAWPRVVVNDVPAGGQLAGQSPLPGGIGGETADALVALAMVMHELPSADRTNSTKIKAAMARVA